MRAGWVGNDRLRDFVQRVDSAAGFVPEIVQIEDSDIKDLRSEWAAGSVSGGSVAVLDGGGARLGSSATTAIAPVTNDGTDVTRLADVLPYDAVLVTWISSGAEDRELHQLTARLNPRADGGSPKTVAEWRAQLWRVLSIDGDNYEIAPISREVVVEATGDVADDFTFDFVGFGGAYPVVGSAPRGATRPMTLIRVTAHRVDGSPADNVTWLADSVSGAQITDSATYIATHYEVDIPVDPPEATSGHSLVSLASTVNNFPEFTLGRAAYTAATITFSSTEAIADLSGSGELVIIARGETPSDSELTFEIWDGSSAWVECVDGDVVGVDNTGRVGGGSDLSGIPTTGPWDIRVTLTPSSAASLNTPTVREFGIERRVSAFLNRVCEFDGGVRQVDPFTLKGNIPRGRLIIPKTGDADGRDYGSNLLAQNHTGQVQVRMWIGDVSGAHLARSEWMLHSIWDIDDYVSTPSRHEVELVSPIRRLLALIPPFVVTSGADGTRDPVQVTGTLKEAYDEIVDTLIGLPGRLIGPGIENTTHSVSKRIERAIAKDELDRLAYLDGSGVIESQGRVKAVKMMRPAAGVDTPVALFPLNSYRAEAMGPGFSTRTDEFFIRYRWDDELEFFEDERRYVNATALGALGGIGIDTTQELDEETCKWITSETLADVVGDRVPKHFGNGLIIWPIIAHQRNPQLEPGDVAAIVTKQFVARSPISGQEIRGIVAALAIVTQVRDKWGTDLHLWVPSFDKITADVGTVTRGAFADEVVVTIPAAAFGGNGDDGELTPSTTGVQEFYYAELALPAGAEILSMRTQGLRVNAGDTCEVTLNSPTAYTGTAFTGFSMIVNEHAADAAWTQETDGLTIGIPHKVQAGRPYSVRVELQAASSVADAKFAWAEITYRRLRG